jgi:hypothetical protein
MNKLEVIFMKELQRHIDAFEIYFKTKQSGKITHEAIKLVALELGFSTNAIYTWKKEFDWDGREAIRSREINKQIERKTDSSIVTNKIKYLAIVHKPIDDLITKMDAGETVLVIENDKQAERYLKLALLLQDQTTENTNITDESNSTVKQVNDLFKLAEEGNKEAEKLQREKPF